MLNMEKNQSWCKQQLLRKDSLKGQILKYFLCGGLVVLTERVIFYTLGLSMIPIFKPSDPIVEYFGITITAVSEIVQSRNIWIVKTICWVSANLIAYLLNRWFVFEPGRHKKNKEVVLFFIFALPQFIFIGLTDFLVRLGWEVTYADYSMMFLAAIINFLVRKFLIFKR